jgi:hypothetical protein
MNKLVITVALAISTIGVGSAQTILQHVNDNNPTTEGFALTGGVAGYGTNDGGVLAWAIQDTSSDFGYYAQDLTPAQETLLAASPWQVVWRMSMIDEHDPINAINRSVEINFQLNNGGGLGERRYNLQFGRTNNNNAALINIVGGPYLSLPGYGTGYHTWELRRIPGSNTARLMVDGTFVTNVSGFADTSPSLWFGSITPIADSTGQAHWAMVLVEVPEPSALALVAAALPMLLWLRRR